MGIVTSGLSVRRVLAGVLAAGFALYAAAPQVSSQAVRPSVTAVSGTLDHNQALTIAGSNFGTRSSGAPLKYDDFQTVAVGAAIDTSSAPGRPWTDYTSSQPIDPVASTAKLRPGTPYTKNMRSRWRSGPMQSSSAVGFNNQPFTKILLDFWLYHDLSACNPCGDINVKPWRLNSSANDMFMNFYGPNSADSYALDVLSGLSGGYFGSNGQPSLRGADAYNQWQHFTYVVDFGSGGGATNGWGYVYRNGVLRQSWRNIGITHFGNDASLLFGNYVRGDVADYSGEQSAYWESVYIDTVLSRVEIGNNANYASATHREIQVPSEWSNGSITVKLNRGSFPSMSGLYLYVIDSQNNASAGFPLGGAPTPTATPSAPRNLRLVPGP